MRPNADQVRPAPPPLTPFADAECPTCGQFVTTDPDGFVCEHCGLWWARDGAFDGWVDCD